MNIDELYLLDLAKALIRCRSVTPDEGGALSLLESHLQNLGFTCRRMPFSETGTADVDNLFARIGDMEPHLAFAGHTDVVPSGDEALWTHAPFAADEANGILYGRGAVDMKGAIACWITAIKAYLQNGGKIGSLSLIITGDEEGASINGTRKMLEALKKTNDLPQACITGEPTSAEFVGDTIKNGRRGSMNFTLQTLGKAGHTGYPHNADNAAHKILPILNHIANWKIDDGNENFEASHASITHFNINNTATNVIPDNAEARFNIRFNNLHTAKNLKNSVQKIIETYITPKEYNLTIISAFEAFLNSADDFCSMVQQACKNSGAKANLSTKGGTSDSRFIKDYCPVIDLGLVGTTMHKTDEAVPINDLNEMTQIYANILQLYFNGTT